MNDSIPKIKFESETKDGKRNGLRRGWYESGEIKFETIIRMDGITVRPSNGTKMTKEKELQFKQVKLVFTKTGTLAEFLLKNVSINKQHLLQVL